MKILKRIKLKLVEILFLALLIFLVIPSFLPPFSHIFANEEIGLEEEVLVQEQGEEYSEEEVAEESQEVWKGRILEHKKVDCGGITQGEEIKCFSYEIEILEGEYEEEIIETMPTWINNQENLFEEGSKVYVSKTQDLEGEQAWTVESYSREGALLLLGIIFVVVIVLVTGFRGITATVGLLMSFFTLYFFAIPRMNTGADFLLISLATLFILLCASTFITYGLNIKSLIAFISTFLGILIIAGIGYIVVSTLNISGSGEEASAMLFDTTAGAVKLSSVFLFSILVGALGVLDDVTVGQASSMMELYETDNTLTAKELFKKSMNIGKDHISSMVNTLFIAYAGSSFSFVMLLSANNPDFRILINTGFIVEEIVRTLVASIGLVLIVPLTSFLASRIIVKVLK